MKNKKSSKELFKYISLKDYARIYLKNYCDLSLKEKNYVPSKGHNPNHKSKKRMYKRIEDILKKYNYTAGINFKERFESNGYGDGYTVIKAIPKNKNKLVYGIIKFLKKEYDNTYNGCHVEGYLLSKLAKTTDKKIKKEIIDIYCERYVYYEYDRNRIKKDYQKFPNNYYRSKYFKIDKSWSKEFAVREIFKRVINNIKESDNNEKV